MSEQPVGRLRRLRGGTARAVRPLHALPIHVDAKLRGATGSIRVATYNIHKGVLREFFGLKQISRIHELRSRLHELDADLIFLQEVQGRHARNEKKFDQWPAEPQAAFLAQSPSLTHTFESAYGQNATYLHGHHGNAFLSRFPILQYRHRDISDHLFEQRGLLHCVTQIGGRDVHCFVVHLGLFSGSRQRQADAMVDWILSEIPADAPLIVAGDFNDWRERLSDRLCRQLGMVEVFDAINAARRSRQVDKPSATDAVDPVYSGRVRGARTFPALVPWLRMDRIYQRGFVVQHVRVLRGPTWARLSDHSPLIADLVLSNPLSA